VFVPLLVPENVPDCVARVPSHNVVRCAEASASSSSAFHATVISQPSFVVVTTELSIVHVAPLALTVISHLSQSDTHPPEYCGILSVSHTSVAAQLVQVVVSVISHCFASSCVCMALVTQSV
jgi:hypothetical protein